MNILPSGNHLRLYWWLSLFWEKNGYAPTYRIMSRELVMGSASIHRMVKDLVEYGLIEKRPGYSRGVFVIPVDVFLANLCGRIKPFLEVPSNEHLAKIMHVRTAGCIRRLKKQPKKEPAVAEH